MHELRGAEEKPKEYKRLSIADDEPTVTEPWSQADIVSVLH